jgi:hypothetical protein
MDYPGLLSRFLPPVPDGLARAFLAENTAPAAFVLDPFGSSPRFVVEMARAGRRVIVSSNNPVSRFLLDLAAHPPADSDLLAALADLSAARKDGERLETHIKTLYRTRCESCGRELIAEAFLWDSKTGTLVGRIYNCTCGDGGEHPATPLDIEYAATWARTEGLHRARVLNRLAPPDDPGRGYAEEALDIYLPRAIYALSTIINRFETLPTTDERRRCLLALLLWACDVGTSLWPHAGERPRPRQLTLPGIFRENNLWMALEAAVKNLSASQDAPVPLTLWPEDPPESGGICVYEGPFRELAPQLEETPIRAVLAVLPRPNQAFWTLSALWAGWLWGKEALGPFRAVLQRRRYDWNWQAEALKALLGNIQPLVSAQTPIFALLPEPEPAALSAALVAGQNASLGLQSIDLRSEHEPAQILWRKIEKTPKNRLPLDSNFARQAIRAFLAGRDAPMPYLFVHTAALIAFAQKGMLPSGDESIVTLEKVIFQALASGDFVDVEGRANPETGVWSLKDRQEKSLFDESLH